MYLSDIFLLSHTVYVTVLQCHTVRHTVTFYYAGHHVNLMAM